MLNRGPGVFPEAQFPPKSKFPYPPIPPRPSSTMHICTASLQTSPWVSGMVQQLRSKALTPVSSVYFWELCRACWLFLPIVLPPTSLRSSTFSQDTSSFFFSPYFLQILGGFKRWATHWVPHCYLVSLLLPSYSLTLCHGATAFSCTFASVSM